MKKILHIISSPRTDASVSRKLGSVVIEKIKEKYPDSYVKERDLEKDHFPHLEEAQINSFFILQENRSPEQRQAIQLSDEVIDELHEADIIVLETSMYNFSVPSRMKAWIDHISRAGKTFRFSEKGPEGLLKNKKLYIAFSGGSVYSEGAYQQYDFNVPYIKTLFNFFGVTDISVFRAEGLNIPIVQDAAFQKGVDSIVIA